MFTNSLVAKSLLALSMLAAAPLAAEAGHRNSYCYSGHRYGCHGETHMINALTYLDREYFDRHSDRYLFAADRELRQAYRELHSRRARGLVAAALEHMHHYVHNHDRRELDVVASLVSQALRAEQLQFRSQHRPPHYGGGHGHGGHGHGYQQGRPAIRIGGIVIGF